MVNVVTIQLLGREYLSMVTEDTRTAKQIDFNPMELDDTLETVIFSIFDTVSLILI
jgi:hypothetical protein